MRIAEALLVVIGAFLIADSIWFNAISFDYSAYGIAWLDPVIDHWMIGAVLVACGAVMWWKHD